jgi:diguanylate cyclase (GGDEF)-like protein
MDSFSLPQQNDMMQKYKRQTYLLAFPIGVVITTLFLILIAEKNVQFYIAICMVVELILLILLLLFAPGYIRFVDLAFYFSYATYFLAVTQLNLYTAGVNGSLNMGYVGENVNSLSMWLIVFLVGGYLSLYPADVRKLIVYVFTALIAIAAYDLWFLYSKNELQYGFIFRWVSAIASLSLATLLIQRMGVLQQRYASTDALTGLMNRHALYRILTQEMERSVRYQKPFSIILIDLDFFKEINDTYGHLTGDTVLKEMSKLISGLIRQIDHICRWGGEEFLLALPETDDAHAQVLAERIREKIEETRFFERYYLTASFGVTAYHAGQSLESLIEHADKALYQAKNDGRNKVSVVQKESD